KAVIVEPMHKSVGEVEPGKLLHYNYTLRNDGDAKLTITDLKGTCYCTTGQADAMQVPPGGSTTVHVRIDPSDFTGDIQKGLEIYTNDPANPMLTVSLDLKVRPGIAVMPPELDFRAIGPQGAKEQSVDVKAP